MGHATHFLSRLERLEPAEVELALSLYRDPKLLAGVLASARLPEGAERVAIALRRQSGGPHLVVTRHGHFVTCLGSGMSIAGLPVLARGQLDTRAERFERLRECIATANSGRNTRTLLDGLVNAGHLLSREEFAVLEGLAPLMCGNYLELLARFAVSVAQERPALAAKCARLGTARPGNALRTLLLDHWNRLWSTGHFAALVTDQIREVMENAADKSQESMLCFTTCAFETRFGPTFLRGLLLPSRIGKLALPAYKQLFRASQDLAELIRACSALTVIAIRHEPTRAEILKLLARRPSSFEISPELGALLDEYLASLRIQIESPRGWCQCAAETALEPWADWTRELPADSGLRVRGEPTEEQLALSLTARCNVPANLENDLEAVVVAAPLVATAGPEMLYLPRAVLDELRPVRGEEWAVQQAMRLLLDFRSRYPDLPERVASAPGPNERCPCGSGLKFKRCCQNKAA